MPVVIKSDNKWRQFKYGYELPKRYRKQFDWMNNREFEDSNFAYYRKQYYPLQEFMTLFKQQSGYIGPLKKWDGYVGWTYDSGVVIKVSRDGERYKIGRFYVKSD